MNCGAKEPNAQNERANHGTEITHAGFRAKKPISDKAIDDEQNADENIFHRGGGLFGLGILGSFKLLGGVV